MDIHQSLQDVMVQAGYSPHDWQIKDGDVWLYNTVYIGEVEEVLSMTGEQIVAIDEDYLAYRFEDEHDASCDLTLVLTNLDRLSVKGRLDGLWVKTAKWFISQRRRLRKQSLTGSLISVLRQPYSLLAQISCFYRLLLVLNHVLSG